MEPAREIPVVSWAERVAGRDAASARVQRVRDAVGRPYERTRPRDPDEADRLLEFGTPQRLVGPRARR